MTTISCSNGVAAFLDLIAAAEGTSTNAHTQNDGYDVIVSGVDGAHTFSDYSIHPFSQGRAPIIVREPKPAVYNTAAEIAAGGPEIIAPAEHPLYSTASGRYQITLPTWEELTFIVRLGTFSPQSQDLGAIELLRQARALDPIADADIATAVKRCCMTWASFPGNSYGQGGRSLDWLQTTYANMLTAILAR